MKRFIFGLIGALFLLGWCFPVYAADLKIPAAKAPPAAPIDPYSWSGLWVGAFFGGAINSTKPEISSGSTAFDLGSAPRGVLGGLELGVDFQFSPNFVFGLYGEGALANISDTGAVTSASVTMLANGIATNYILGAGGRLGVLITPTTMLYGKGGVAGIGAKPNWQVGSLQQAASDTSIGWMAGGGIEHKLGGNWSVKLEYDHYAAGDRVLTFTDSSGAVIATGTNKISIDAVRGGIDYRF